MSESHCVYAICCPDSGKYVYVKFGRSKDVEARLADLKTGCPLHPRLVYFVCVGALRNAVQLERYLHLRFDHCRETGEWFRFDAEGLKHMHLVCHAALASLPMAEPPKWEKMDPRRVMKPSYRGRRENLARLKKEAA